MMTPATTMSKTTDQGPECRNRSRHTLMIPIAKPIVAVTLGALLAVAS